MGLMSLRDYAKHRAALGLPGNAAKVSEAIKVGRLKESVARDDRGDPKIADVELADREWELNTDPLKREHAMGEKAIPMASATTRVRVDGVLPPESSPPRELDQNGAESVGSANQRKKIADANLAELKFAEAAGQLVAARDVEQRLVEVFSQCKTRLLAIPSRARQELPHLSLVDVAAIETLVREAVEDLSEE